MDYHKLHELKLRLAQLIMLLEKLELPDGGRTRMMITDIQAYPGHTNEKGIYIHGFVIIGVQVNYADFEWKKPYKILQAEMDQFTLDEFKKRIYQKSRIWIKEKELEADVLGKLKGQKNEIVYLD